MRRSALGRTVAGRISLGVALLMLLSSGAGRAAPAAHPAIFIHGGTLIDGTGAPPRPNGGLLISDDRISTIGDAAQVPADATRIAADGKWIAPGLFDLHAHITFHLAGARDLEDDVVNAVRSERFLERYQQIGVTTVRDVGSRYRVGFSLKRAQRSGLIGGARFYTSGPIITTTGGHATEFQPLLPPIFAVEANGPWEFRARVREAVKLGADLIKVTPPYTPEELAATVSEAHGWNRRVTAHIGGPQDLHQVSARIAIDAGVDSLEHLYPYGEPGIVAAIASRKILVIPTLGYHLREFNGEFSQTRESLKASLHHTPEGMMALFGQLRAAGVRFGVGTDSNAKDLATIDQLYLQELEGLASGGLPRMQIIQSATLHAAEAMGLDDVSGSLAKGKWADVVVLDADPLVSLRALVAPLVVIQAGRIVHDARPLREGAARQY